MMTLEEAIAWLDASDDYTWPIIKQHIQELKDRITILEDEREDSY